MRTLLLALLAGGLLVASLKFPLWHICMEAPQYREQEALRVEVLPGSMRGNLSEIRVLNQYIGVQVPQQLPQTRWLPAALLLTVVLGLGVALLPLRSRRFAALGVAAALAIAMLAAAGQARWQMYEIGHNRNHHSALKGVADFTPPLLGKIKLANFELEAGLGLGSFFIAGAIVLYAGMALLAPSLHPSPPFGQKVPEGQVQGTSINIAAVVPPSLTA